MQLHQELGAVRRETELDAPREAVWKLLADPGPLGEWLGDEVALDEVAPGARGTVREGDVIRHVTIEDVDEERRVALTWCAPGDDPSLVELTLDDAGGGRTRLVVVEVPLATLRVAAAPLVARVDATPRRGPQMAALAA